MNSVEAWLRTLQARTDDFRQRLEEMLMALTDTDAARKVHAGRAAYQSLANLQVILDESARPAWMKYMFNALGTYSNKVEKQGPQAAYQVVKEIINIYRDVAEQTWSAEDAVPVLDFESLYQRYFADSKLPELFESLIGKLEEIVASGQVDNLRLLRTLEAGIRVLRRNMRGTYFSAYGAWQFTQRFMENALWEGLEAIPVIAPLVKAVRKTIDEMQAEMDQIRANAGAAITSSVDETLRLPPPPAYLLEAGLPDDGPEPASPAEISGS